MSERVATSGQALDRESGFFPRRTPTEIIGAHGGLRSALERAAELAAGDGPVVVLGERGAGRETIARALHAKSARADGPLVVMRGRGLTIRELDALLHRAGEARGTVYIDEVTSMPRDVQRALAVALRTVRSSTTGRPMNRVIVSSARELGGAADSGGVEEDLFYELRSPLRVPALRERVSDIPGLAAMFARRAADTLGVAPAELTPTDLELIGTYAWPGNVRELALVMERAVLLADGQGIDVARALGTAPVSEPESLNLAMVKRIERALARTSGRIEGPRGAAAELGINPHTLRARMRKLGIAWARFRPNP